MQLEELTGYEILEKREITDLNSIGYILRHKKSGARVALLSNDDENKVFYIGFRTPPKDSTGVAHILEHSVLCGSKEFPIKDPFVELVKGSLNTFLNAMTYPDKTMYPVASCNDKDFENLMHVYLDAVFYPNIYTNQKIFWQEGWHYEMDSLEDDLKVNGVVYNEMKGALSSPDDVMEREIMNSLFPDTTYGYESGGDPKDIPNLTYEQFLEFHKKYYHPSNSYIYLYGNMDMAKQLKFIDENYLSAFDAMEIDSEVPIQKSFEDTKRIVKEYPLSEGEDEEENTFISLNMCLEGNVDPEAYVAFSVIEYALCSAPGAVLKQALVDAGIGNDIYSIYDNGIKQPYFSIIAKDTQVEKEKQFLEIIQAVLQNVVENGFDDKALLAAINHYEFRYREADFGSYPKGLMYGLQMMDSWLYDDMKPFVHVEQNQTYAALKEKVKTDYYQKLVEKYFIDNKHKAIVILKPQTGLMEKEEQAFKEKMLQKKNSLSEKELQTIIDNYKALTAYQESEDAKEDLEKLPLLKREDLKKEAPKYILEERIVDGTKLLFHNLFTNKIAYFRMIFDLSNIPEEYFKYLGLLKGCLGLLDTQNYSYGELANEINLVTGGTECVTNTYGDVKDTSKCKVTFEVKTRVLYENIDKAIDLMKEMILTTDFTNTKRIYELIAEGKSRMQSSMISAGHSVALSRARAYGNVAAAMGEIIGGIPFYRLIAHLEEHFEEEKDKLVTILQELSAMIFREENLMLDLVSEETVLDKLTEPIKNLKASLYTKVVKKAHFVPEVSKKNEGFMTSAQVQFVCRAGNYKKAGLDYHGSLNVLKVIMGYEYLWVNVRVKGGAYGCMCGFGKSGECYFVSYRDPNLIETIDIYENAAEAVGNFEADERTMTQYVIGAISDLDIPMNPAAKGMSAMSAYMTGITWEMQQKERDEILATTPEDIRALGKNIKAFMQDEYLCVVGNASKIKEHEDVFMKTENLF